MEINLLLILNSALLGAGLAMDAFSVSVANGLAEPDMKASRAAGIAGTFGIFQFLMPLIGWACVHTAAEALASVQPFIPWIALGLLLFLGIRMIAGGVRGKAPDAVKEPLRGRELLTQGVATSIDALSAGFVTGNRGLAAALTETLIIGAVTFGLCLIGIRLGQRAGRRLSGRAETVGGVILILVGLEIFLTGIL